MVLAQVVLLSLDIVQKGLLADLAASPVFCLL
jgi:hypothetical protein